MSAHHHRRGQKFPGLGRDSRKMPFNWRDSRTETPPAASRLVKPSTNEESEVFVLLRRKTGDWRPSTPLPTSSVIGFYERYPDLRFCNNKTDEVQKQEQQSPFQVTVMPTAQGGGEQQPQQWDGSSAAPTAAATSAPGAAADVFETAPSQQQQQQQQRKERPGVRLLRRRSEVDSSPGKQQQQQQQQQEQEQAAQLQHDRKAVQAAHDLMQARGMGRYQGRDAHEHVQMQRQQRLQAKRRPVVKLPVSAATAGQIGGDASTATTITTQTQGRVDPLGRLKSKTDCQSVFDGRLFVLHLPRPSPEEEAEADPEECGATAAAKEARQQRRHNNIQALGLPVSISAVQRRMKAPSARAQEDRGQEAATVAGQWESPRSAATEQQEQHQQRLNEEAEAVRHLREKWAAAAAATTTTVKEPEQEAGSGTAASGKGAAATATEGEPDKPTTTSSGPARSTRGPATAVTAAAAAAAASTATPRPDRSGQRAVTVAQGDKQGAQTTAHGAGAGALAAATKKADSEAVAVGNAFSALTLEQADGNAASKPGSNNTLPVKTAVAAEQADMAPLDAETRAMLVAAGALEEDGGGDEGFVTPMSRSKQLRERKRQKAEAEQRKREEAKRAKEQELQRQREEEEERRREAARQRRIALRRWKQEKREVEQQQLEQRREQATARRHDAYDRIFGDASEEKEEEKEKGEGEVTAEMQQATKQSTAPDEGAADGGEKAKANVSTTEVTPSEAQGAEATDEAVQQPQQQQQEEEKKKEEGATAASPSGTGASKVSANTTGGATTAEQTEAPHTPPRQLVVAGAGKTGQAVSPGSAATLVKQLSGMGRANEIPQINPKAPEFVPSSHSGAEGSSVPIGTGQANGHMQAPPEQQQQQQQSQQPGQAGSATVNMAPVPVPAAQGQQQQQQQQQAQQPQQVAAAEAGQVQGASGAETSGPVASSGSGMGADMYRNTMEAPPAVSQPQIQQQVQAQPQAQVMGSVATSQPAYSVSGMPMQQVSAMQGYMPVHHQPQHFVTSSAPQAVYMHTMGQPQQPQMQQFPLHDQHMHAAPYGMDHGITYAQHPAQAHVVQMRGPMMPQHQHPGTAVYSPYAQQQPLTYQGQPALAVYPQQSVVAGGPHHTPPSTPTAVGPRPLRGPAPQPQPQPQAPGYHPRMRATHPHGGGRYRPARGPRPPMYNRARQMPPLSPGGRPRPPHPAPSSSSPSRPKP